ncbi:unnamed protein product [Rotaria sp. Silwood2]|nr:unnamed protein product [Rotaria sp. Silwood2]CAF3207219.1 unnamed protein product [Rotaria sp. Silwood2]CAF3365489.1 unnamed protein product [Rotaria sp. Silwood2]CAF4023811.1 unnamed protein product [Rotaria sp. Silwood2]CAF4274689.1 unnamed protein product [Rotaria sp. Silwood2]
MSMLLAGGRSVTAHRISQNGVHRTNYPMQWSSSSTQRHESLSPLSVHRDSASSIILRRESISLMGRRRALDLYGTKDVLFTHEQMKKATRYNTSATGFHSFGWTFERQHPDFGFKSLRIPLITGQS